MTYPYLQICATNSGLLHRGPNNNVATDGYLQFSSYQEPVSRRENRRSSICNQSFVTD